jgi:hypothetical protein
MLLFKNILTDWFFWHYLEMPREIGRIWKNFLLFNLQYFSIFSLLKTLFFPWRRYQLSYKGGFNPQRYFEAFIFNSFSRMIGFLFRGFLIIIGLFFEVFIIIIGIIFIFGWLFLPFFLCLGFYYGFKQFLF